MTRQLRVRECFLVTRRGFAQCGPRFHIRIDFFFFLNAIPVFCHTAFTVPFRSAVFPLINAANDGSGILKVMYERYVM
jgi:hypothetical protein